MQKTTKPKNIVIIDGLKKFKRWTILDVEISVVKSVKDYAAKNGYTTAKALKELVVKGLENDD